MPIGVSVVVVVTGPAAVTVSALPALNEPSVNPAVSLFNVVDVVPVSFTVVAILLAILAAPDPFMYIALNALFGLVTVAVAPDRFSINMLAVSGAFGPCDIAVSLLLVSALVNVIDVADSPPVKPILPAALIDVVPVAVMLSDCR